MKRGQASLEYVMLIGMFVAVLSLVIFFTTNQINTYVLENEANDAARSIARAVSHVGALGPGSTKVIVYQAPSGAWQRYTGYRDVVFYMRDDVHIHHPTNVPVFGLLEPGRGNKYVVVRAENNGYVSLSPLSHPRLYDGLIAYYNFETKNETHVIDVSGNSPAGEMLSGVDCSVTGYIGRSCRFDGGNISIPKTEWLLYDFATFSFWFRFAQADQSSDYSGLLQLGLPGYNQVRIYSNNTNNGIDIRIDTGSSSPFFNQVTGISVTDNIWQHYVAVLNEGTVSVYINGVLRAEEGYEGSDFDSTNGIFRIGSQDTRYFNGTIDEVMIWNRALSEDEIQKLYLLGREP